MKYKVYECEERTTGTGEPMKKLVLQGEGKQYPDKWVTMWSDHPLFETVAPGQTIDVELQVKDSRKPNPRGGFYKNKTVLKPGQTPEPPKMAPGAADDAKAYNYLMFKIEPLLQQILMKLDGDKPGPAYPVMSTENNAASFDLSEDSPF